MPLPPDSLQLFGTFQLLHRGQPIALGQPRLEELLALLAIRPGISMSRAQIAYQFWPNSSEKQARSNVRNLIHKLRRAWPDLDDALTIDRSGAVWREDADIDVDVHRFDALHRQAGESLSFEERARLLSATAQCYQGNLLPNCYADWALIEREELRSQYVAVLDALIDTSSTLRRYEDALGWAKQLRNHDPLQESTYRRLMQIYAERSDRAAALRTYHSCASMLEKELGVEPSEETAQLYAQLLQHDQAVDERPDGLQAIPRRQLVGRHPEWQALRRAWNEAGEGQAHCVLIWGEAGIGKTRLAEEIIDWVRRQGHVWASSRSYAAQGALTYAPIAEWLRAPGIESVLETMEDLWRVEVARLRPDLLAHRPDLPAPGPLSETWQQQRFFQSIVRTLQMVPGPLLLHLDDMQWSDIETLNLLQFLLHGLREHPLLIVGTIRTEDAGNQAELGTFIETVQHTNQLTELRLGPISPAEAAELAAQTADEPITPEMAETLFTASEGHPLFLIETVRSGLHQVEQPHIDGEHISASSQSDRHIKIPPKIYNLISSRLGQLSPMAQEVASTAAVIGRNFTYRALQWAISMDDLALVDAPDELWTRHIVREQDGDRYDFSHDRIREVAYQEISRARRRLIHRRVAEALEAIHADNLDDVAGELAAHCALAGDSERAYQFYRRAAELAMDRHALVHAEAMFDAALSYAPDDPVVRFDLLAEQSRVFYSSLQLSPWRSNLDEQETLLASMPQPDPRLNLTLHVNRSHYFGITGEGKAAMEAALAAVTIAEQLGEGEALALAYQELASGHWMESRMAEAKPLFGQSAAYARDVGNVTIEATSLEMYAACGMFSGMPSAQLLEILNRTYQLAEETGDLQKMCSLFNKFGYLRIASGMGDFDTAENDYQRGIALSGEIGNLSIKEVLLSNLGVCFTNKGDYRRALATLNVCLAMGESYPNYWRYLVSRHHLGALWMQMGNLDEAHAEFAHACEQLSAQGNRHFEVKARCDLGLLYHLAGESFRAQEELSHVLTLIEGHGDLRFEALVSTRLGYVLEATDQLDDAGQMYAYGYDLHRQMEQDYYALNALAGSARVARLQGDDATALAHAEMIWETIAGQETDATVETTRTLRTCYEVFRIHADPQAMTVFNAACDQLQRRVATIDDPRHVRRFWQLDDHRFFLQAAETRSQS